MRRWRQTRSFVMFAIALIQLARNAELNRCAFQRVVFGFFDAGFGVDIACADAFARDAVDCDRCDDHYGFTHLRDLFDRVSPRRGLTIKDVGHGVPLHVFDHVFVTGIIRPTFARFDQIGVQRLAQATQRLRKGITLFKIVVSPASSAQCEPIRTLFIMASLFAFVVVLFITFLSSKSRLSEKLKQDVFRLKTTSRVSSVKQCITRFSLLQV